MKLSADRNNVHYSPLAYFATVFIDGVKVSNAVTLDTDSLEYTIADTSFYDGNDYSSIYRVLKAKESIEVKFREDTPEWLLRELLEKGVTMLSQKKKLEIANICYANISSDFAMMLNTRYQGSKFTWEGWVARMQREADLWLILNDVKGNTKANEVLARKYAKEIAERLVELSGVDTKCEH